MDRDGALAISAAARKGATVTAQSESDSGLFLHGRSMACVNKSPCTHITGQGGLLRRYHIRMCVLCCTDAMFLAGASVSCGSGEMERGLALTDCT